MPIDPEMVTVAVRTSETGNPLQDRMEQREATVGRDCCTGTDKTLSGMTVTITKHHQGDESMESIQVKTDAKKKQQKGVTTVEYAVMLVLVAIAVLAFGKGIANSVTNVFSTLASSLG